jgi:hypothetical protein
MMGLNGQGAFVMGDRHGCEPEGSGREWNDLADRRSTA